MPVNDNDDGSATCPQCGRVFSGFPGRRRHQRFAHPDLFHAEAAAAARRSKARWQRDELIVLAREEARRHEEISALCEWEVAVQLQTVLPSGLWVYW